MPDTSHQPVERSFEEIGWRIRMVQEEYCCRFELFELSGDWQEDPPVIYMGSVKWDGCSNWKTNPDYMQHFCERERFFQFAEALGKCHDWANEIFKFDEIR